MNLGTKAILDYLLEKRGFDFSGYHQAMLERRIGKRLAAAKCSGFGDYHDYLQQHPEEMDHLLDVLTINVSRFFRDTLTFELMADRILPAIILKKARQKDRSLRIWSAACAMGEEPYSVAILVHEFLRKEGLTLDLHFFATDIDPKVLEQAEEAVYPLSSVKNIKYRLLKKYFTKENESFRLIPEIREQVTFCPYDILDKRHRFPPESIYGHFDLVLCRNLLIYFNPEYQEIIFEKLYNALAQGGYLVVGEAETPPLTYQTHFTRELEFSPIYRRR